MSLIRAAGRGNQSREAAAAAATIAALKLVQAYHTARFAPFRALIGNFMAFVVLLLEAAYSLVVMVTHLEDASPESTAVSRHFAT